MRVTRRFALLTVFTAGSVILLSAAMATALASPVVTDGGWPAPIQVSQSGGSASRLPGLQLDNDGTLRAFWLEQALLSDTLHYTIHAAKSTDGGGNWSLTIPLTPTTADRYEAVVDADEYGGMHLVWRESPGLHQVWYGELWEGGWEPPAPITTTQYVTIPIFGPAVEVAGDWVHAAWSERNVGPTGASPFEIFYSRGEFGEIWSKSAMVAETGQTSLQLRMTADQHHNLHMVWQENSSPRSILYISGTVYTTDTVWSAPITVSVGLSENAATPCIAVGSDDVVHVAFGVDVQEQIHVQDVYYAHFPVSNTSGISPTLIPGSRVDISQLLPTYASPVMALVGTDDLHVVWNGMQEGDYSDRIYYSVSNDGGASWSEPVPATPRDSWPDGFASLAAAGDFVHLIYQQKVSSADQDIYYTKRFPISAPLSLALKAY
jgi:hypothetical protein